MNNFPYRLKEALELRDMNGAELARRLHVGRSAVSQWISGKYGVSNERTYEIAKILNVSPGWLFGSDVPFDSFDGSENKIQEHNSNDYIIKELLQLNESNKRVARGFIEGLLYQQKNENK